ncbi:MAG: hypothetical protein RLY97_1291 [Pseudomonadota bacterium]
MPETQTHTGGCGCGATRYQLTGTPIFINNCHCKQCQQQTGSTSVVNAFYESESIQLTSGTLTEHGFKSGSGGQHIICRCASCGSALFSYYPRFGRLGAGVRVGTLDDSAAFKPDAVVHAAERMPWVALPSDIPAFDVYYNPKELLPPDRFARFMALYAKASAS